jgi:hypothetical protein
MDLILLRYRRTEVNNHRLGRHLRERWPNWGVALG